MNRLWRKHAGGWCGALILVIAARAIPVVADYSEREEARHLVEELVADERLDRETLTAMLAVAERQDAVLEAIARPVEKTLPWYKYRKIFITDERLQGGYAFMSEHAETLRLVEADSGVPAEVVTAILGVETYYGRITGNYRVLDALATLAFDYPPRSAFFTRELRQFLLLTQEQALDPLTLTGSYAGAMGLPQFMPSSYRSYAVDFDGDGSADIWSRPDDAIASVANYLRRHGWRREAPVVIPVDVGPRVPPTLFDEKLKPAHDARGLLAAGVVPRETLPPDEPRVSTIRLEREDGFRYWLGLNNFYVITRYNHSAMYAMSVYQLSSALARGRE